MLIATGIPSDKYSVDNLSNSNAYLMDVAQENENHCGMSEVTLT